MGKKGRVNECGIERGKQRRADRECVRSEIERGRAEESNQRDEGKERKGGQR